MKNKKKTIKRIGVNNSLYKMVRSKFEIKISDDWINLFKTNTNKIIWGDSDKIVAIVNCLIFKLKRTPEKFLIINGIPGINRKIMNKKNAFFFTLNLFKLKLIDPFRPFAKKKEIVEPIVNETIETIQLAYPKNKVEIMSIGLTMPTRQIQRIEIKK